MKKEFKNFFLKKYILIILALLIAICIISWLSMVKEPSDSDAYHNFISILQPYRNKEMLESLYNATQDQTPTTGIVNNTNPSINLFRSYAYKFALDNDLPYDSLVTFSEITKYTPFHYFSIFNIAMSLFIVLASILMGSFYQSTDIMTKMSKLVYTSGEKKSKIIDNKYGVSLIALLTIIFLLDFIFALLGLRYKSSGAKYCVVFTGERMLYYNYLQFVCLLITSHLIMAFLTYTFVYYLTVIIKNGIIPLCILLVSLVVYNFAVSGINHNTRIMLDMILRGGFIGVFYNPQSHVTNLNFLWNYIAVAIVSIIPAIISRFTIKRADYSR